MRHLLPDNVSAADGLKRAPASGRGRLNASIHAASSSNARHR